MNNNEIESYEGKSMMNSFPSTQMLKAKGQVPIGIKAIKGPVLVQIQTMDAELEFTVNPKETGQDLFDMVCRTIGLRETWYFGLQFVDSKDCVTWLKMDKKIREQGLVLENSLFFNFLAKFYPEEVSEELIQEITQHLFFLQVKQSILNMNIYCAPEAAVFLASYALQAKYGDYDEHMFKGSSFADEAADLLPQRVIDQYQMTTEMWAERIKDWYIDHKGMAKDEAEMQYLKIAQDLDMYGINFFEIKNKKNSELWLGVDSVGLNVYERDNRLTPVVSFPWGEVKNVSFKEKRFVICLVDKGAPDFVFFAPKLRINKLILELCIGNHSLYMQRRKRDTMEMQQMKAQAREEKARKAIERNRYLKEKSSHEETLTANQELKNQLAIVQEEARLTQEALRRSEETAELLAEKARIAEEENRLLTQKAEDAEAEIQRVKVSAIKFEEDKIMMEHKALEAEIIATKSVEELEKRAQEAETLKDELIRARLAEKEAKEKLVTFSRTYLPFGLAAAAGTFYSNLGVIPNGQPLPPSVANLSSSSYSSYPSSFPPSSSFAPSSFPSSAIMSTLVQPTQFVPNATAIASINGGIGNLRPPSFEDPSSSHSRLSPRNPHNSHIAHSGHSIINSRHSPSLANGVLVPNGLSNGLSNGHHLSPSPLASTGDMELLSAEIEKERMEYVEKSRHLSEQLYQLRNEIESLKVEDKTTALDRFHLENLQRGETKYQTLTKIRNGTTGSRVAFFEGL